MDVVFLIGRILFGVLFVHSGFGHLTAGEALRGYARHQGVPAPAVAVPLSGVMIIVGGAGVILGILPDLAALLLVVFLLPTAFMMHAFWRVEDPQMRQMERIHFSKDIALAGAALVIFYAWNQLQGEAGLSITDPLFDRAD